MSDSVPAIIRSTAVFLVLPPYPVKCNSAPLSVPELQQYHTLTGTKIVGYSLF